MRDPDLRSRLLVVADFGERAAIFEDGTGSLPVLLLRRDAGLLAGAGFAQTRDGGRTWSTPRLAPGIAGNYPALAIAASGTLFALDADQRTWSAATTKDAPGPAGPPA